MIDQITALRFCVARWNFKEQAALMEQPNLKEKEPTCLAVVSVELGTTRHLRICLCDVDTAAAAQARFPEAIPLRY